MFFKEDTASLEAQTSKGLIQTHLGSMGVKDKHCI